MNTNQYLFDIFLFLLAIVWISLFLQVAIVRFHSKTALKPKTPRPLKPKTADDCPFCRAEPAKTIDPQPKQPLKPWSEVKSHRGRKKPSLPKVSPALTRPAYTSVSWMNVSMLWLGTVGMARPT
jgi:hypothetical protein